MAVRSQRFARIVYAVLTVYGAQLPPFAVGPLQECDHCVALYSKLFPILPGAIAGIASTSIWRGNDSAALVAAGLMSLVVLAIAYRLAREEGGMRWILLITLGLLLMTQALVIASVLRA